MDYAKHVSPANTKQGAPIFGREDDMKKNYDGAYVFKTGNWEQLKRFLILGTEGGTYYASEQNLTKENATATLACIRENGKQVLELLTDISLKGRAPKNDSALFVLALLCTYGDDATRTAAYNAIPSICRIGTHLFTFLTNIKHLRKWSSGLKRGVASYYLNKHQHKLEMDILKYKARGGFSHRDVLRLSHVKPEHAWQDSLFSVACGNDPKTDNVKEDHPMYWAMKELQALDSAGDLTPAKAAQLVTDHRLPRELIPTGALNHKEVWEAMLPDMPMTALIRNLGKMTSIGLIGSNFSEATKLTLEKMKNMEAVKRSRIHPVNVLVALSTYKEGKGLRGSLEWSPVANIKKGLEDLFYASFEYVEPTGQNLLLAVDVSASMTWVNCNGTFITPREMAAAMAMTFVKTEPNVEVMSFSGDMNKVAIHSNMSLEDVVRKFNSMPAGGTNCSLPIRYAMKRKLPVDGFVVMTDNETNSYHSGHASEELKKFRSQMGRNSKMAVAGFTATNSSIADPADPGMMDFVGFDSQLPKLVSEFLKGL